MSSISVKDKVFEHFISESEINSAVVRIASKMNEELKELDPLFISVLNGSFMFASDLLKNINIPCNITFIRVRSYQNTNTDGNVKEVYGLIEDIQGRNIVIIEDIVDTGYTMKYLKEQLEEKQPQSIRVATFLFKPEALQLPIEPDYVGFRIPNDFVVGYGLDYDGYGRNLKDVYKIQSN